MQKPYGNAVLSGKITKPHQLIYSKKVHFELCDGNHPIRNEKSDAPKGRRKPENKLSPIAPKKGEKIADKHAEKLDVIKVDADEFQDTTARYGIRGIPTLMIFHNGVPQATRVGAASLNQLESFIGDYI